MGLIGQILSFLHITKNDANVSEITVDLGGGDTEASEFYTGVGDDSQPLTGDYLFTINQHGGKKSIAVAYLDPKLSPVAEPGDKRIYSRSADGSVVASVWLKNTGEMVFENEKATITLEADGEMILTNGSATATLKTSGVVDVNGATITTIGDVLTAGGVSLQKHVHTSAAPGSPTSPPIPEG